MGITALNVTHQVLQTPSRTVEDRMQDTGCILLSCKANGRRFTRLSLSQQIQKNTQEKGCCNEGYHMSFTI